MALAAILSKFAGQGAKALGGAASAGMDKLSASLVKLAKSPLDAAKGVSSLVSDISKLGASSTQATGMLGSLTQSLLKSFMDPLEQVKAFAGPLVELVSLANPGVVKQFTIAMNDTMAVFGQVAEPVLKGLTVWVRTFGDSWAKMVPVLMPLMEQLGQTFADMGYLGARVLEAWAPLIQLFVDTMIPIIQQLGQAFAMVNGFIVEVIKTVMDLLGLKATRRDDKKDSRGAAVRNANLTSVEGFAKDLFSMNIKNLFPGAKSKDPVQVQSEILDAIKEGQNAATKLFENILAAVQPVKDIWDFIKEKYSKLPDVKLPSAGGLASSAAGVATGGAGSGVGSVLGISPAGQIAGLLGRALLK